MGSNASSQDSSNSLYDQLIAIGCQVGRSTNGKLLRVDNRSASREPGHDILTRILRCGSLRQLYLRNVSDLELHIQGIAGLLRLQLLDIESSGFSDAALEQLAELESLEVLNVRQTNVTPQCVATLRKRMIGTRIIGP